MACGTVDVVAAAVGVGSVGAGTGRRAMVVRCLDAAAANAADSDPPDGAPAPCRPRLPIVPFIPLCCKLNESPPCEWVLSHHNREGDGGGRTKQRLRRAQAWCRREASKASEHCPVDLA